MRRLAVLATVLAISTSAHAQAIDQAGATRLQQDLARYVSPAAFDNGIVKVTPDADSYRIEIDVKPIVAMILAAEDMKEFKDTLKVDIGPFAVNARPRPDGQWDVSGNSLFPDGKYELNSPDLKMNGEWMIAGGKHSGVYDPALAAFTQSEASFASMMAKSDDFRGRANISYGQFNMTSKGMAAAGGGVDLTASQSIANYDETQQFEMPDGSGTSFPVAIKSPSISVDTEGKGVRTRALLDLLAFGVANADKEKFSGNQAEFKTLLLAALPLWEDLTGKQGIDQLAVTTPMGSLNAQKVDIKFAADGIRDDGEMSMGLELDSMRIASLFMPSWAPPLLPTYVDFNLKADNLDLDKPARKFIAAADFTQDPPLPEAVAKEIEADFTASPPRLLIEKSTLRTALSEFTVEGALTFVATNPNFIGTVEAKDFDKTIEAMQAAAKEMPDLNEAVLGMQMAKGMSKTLADGRSQWLIEAKPDGSVSINGQVVKGSDEFSAPAPAPAETPQPQ